MAHTITLATYNVQGLNPAKYDYINHILMNCDILFIQEHWLFNSQSHLLSDSICNVNTHVVSGMPDNVLINGRPFGGCAILWKQEMV